jgi:hypothetical protein
MRATAVQRSAEVGDKSNLQLVVGHDRPRRRSRFGQVLVPGVLTLAGSALAFCLAMDVKPDPEVQRLLRSPSVAEIAGQGRAKATSQRSEKESLLVAHAKAFVLQVNPPPPVQPQPGPMQPPPTPAPVAFTPKFKVQGVSYCPWRPGQSMVLISEATGELRWVRQGASVDHGVIEEVKTGSVVYRSGGQTWEMGIDH